MATGQKQIFTRNRPLVNIYSGIDHEGKQVEVREDAEQQVKYHEIVEALAGAGYHRAHVQSLSPFDKIVGGITWCIELCDIDVDVSLLFEEDLTIGKKIALTEKIVAVLPSMQCPHVIEPHQIQGLDFINIYPLILWLIKRSDEFREAKEDELQRFAVMQYDKRSIFEMDRERFRRQRQFLKNLSDVQNVYKPRRVRKRRGSPPTGRLEQVTAVLAEYDQRALLHTDTGDKDDPLYLLRDIEKTLADPTTNTVAVPEQMEIPDATDDSEKKLHYAILTSELSGDVTQVIEEREKEKYLEEVSKLKSQWEELEREVHGLRKIHAKAVEDGKGDLIAKKEELQILKEIYSGSQGQILSDKELKEVHATLKTYYGDRNKLEQTIHQKLAEQAKFRETIESICLSGKVEDIPLTEEERTDMQEKEEDLRQLVTRMRISVAEITREELALTVALDERPGQTELLQYEKRFIELLQQVAAKHKETKQFFTFHNTLYEVKLYTSKELSLLNSILDNYAEAMSSSKKREQFMSQLESIVEWVKGAVQKVEQKYQEEKEKKSRLNSEYTQLLEIQRQYNAMLKKLAVERRRLMEESMRTFGIAW